MRRIILPVLVAALLLAGLAALLSLRARAASPGSRILLPIVQAPAETQLLPDLIIVSARFTMSGYQGGCVMGYRDMVVEACIRNQGNAEAGPFGLALKGMVRASSTGLKAGQEACLEIGTDLSNPVDLVVDPDNSVSESDEGNNTWHGYLPVPTPPPICTATPWPSATPSPTPTGTPTISCLRAECSQGTSGAQPGV